MFFYSIPINVYNKLMNDFYELWKQVIPIVLKNIFSGIGCGKLVRVTLVNKQINVNKNKQ